MSDWTWQSTMHKAFKQTGSAMQGTQDQHTTLRALMMVQEEAREAFRELLEETEVASDWTWDSIMHNVIADPKMPTWHH